MKNTFIVFIAILFACSTPNPPPAVIDASAPPPILSVEPPSVAVPPTPMPDWLVSPRPPLTWPEHEAPPVRAPSGPRPKPVLAAGTRPPIIPSSWTVPAWVIDPVNGNDNNTCTTNGSACKTYAEIAARWGTYSPRLRQSTTLTWLTSQPDNTDPIYFTPFAENDATPQIVCSLTQVASGTLGSVTAKNRATPQILQADIGASGAIHQLLIDTTAGGRAWVYKNVAGTIFALSQPLAPAAAPPTLPNGTEVDTFTNGDAFTLNTPVTIDLQLFAPTNGQYVTANNMGYVTNCTTRQAATSRGATFVNSAVRFVESRLSQAAMFVYSQPSANDNGGCFNCDANSGISGGIVTGMTTGSGTGQLVMSAGIVSNLIGAMQVAQDTIVQFAYTATTPGVNSTLGNVCIDTGANLNVSGSQLFVLSGSILWGAGNIKTLGVGHITYTAGQGTATFINTGTRTIDGSATACSHTGAAPDVINCGINITGANLDAAAGAAGFGGNAFMPGGSGIATF